MGAFGSNAINPPIVVSVPINPADVTKKSVELHIPPGNVCISMLLEDGCVLGVEPEDGGGGVVVGGASI
jgi:hypothetical protein